MVTRSLLLFIFVLHILLLPTARSRETTMSRDKRSDDRPAMEAVVNTLSERLTQLEAQVTAQGNANSQLQAQFAASQTMVAFTAWNSGNANGMFNVAAQGTLVYNHAEVNLGGGFDPVTGVFTCPTPGLYIFFVNCEPSNAQADTDARILVDGDTVAICYAHSPYDQGAGLATVRLTAGQKVWVRMFRDTPRDISAGAINSFSGFLIRSDN